ncbi:hypothetical protein ACWGQ4_36495 [Streptomyces sp. NPDC055721]|uniref:hypothetical protein n=1 Tax=Streptomyces sp. NPDC127132 TaxID=3345374 RepID=UPI003635E303
MPITSGDPFARATPPPVTFDPGLGLALLLTPNSLYAPIRSPTPSTPWAHYLDPELNRVHSGAVLVRRGIDRRLPAGDYASTPIRLRHVDPESDDAQSGTTGRIHG